MNHKHTKNYVETFLEFFDSIPDEETKAIVLSSVVLMPKYLIPRMKKGTKLELPTALVNQRTIQNCLCGFSQLGREYHVCYTDGSSIIERVK